MNITNPEKITALLEEPEFQAILNFEEFYFQKGQDKLREWLDLDVNDEIKTGLFSLAGNYNKFKTVSLEKEDLKPIAKLLYTIITYCDSKAYNKEALNEYDDKRTIARAGVYMDAWIKHLLQVKFEQKTEGASTFNAFRYLLHPSKEINVLSEGHRKQISANVLSKPYKKETFVEDIISYFAGYDLGLKNDINKTHLIARILYTFKSDWLDEVIGLTAADSTGWQEEYIEESKGLDGIVLWNSKRPTGTTKTIKALRDILSDGRYFNLYHISKGQALYRTVIKDFATDQKELDKWDIPNKDLIYNYNDNFGDYRDGNKSAKIVFLAERMEKIDSIDINAFSFYNSSAPRQDNLSPIKREPENITMFSIDRLPDAKNSGNGHTISKRHSLNQILYGPPGTGKTYHTINKALEALGEPFAKDSDRKIVKKRFDELVKGGRIVFTTFHQSFSYEDFVEGLKPETESVLTDNSAIRYKIVDGIFKRICKNNLPFQVGDNINGYIVESVSPELLTLKKKRSGSLLPISMRMLHGLNKFLKDNDLPIDKLKEKINFTEDVKRKYPEIEPYLINGYNTIIPNLLKRLDNPTAGIERKVLIIDEINRGNVSQIFGELITLIEEDKRVKANKSEDNHGEALTVKLPYSKDDFSVPDNLYIIGTMNTADRSVEALDSALRRRFVFEEMTPKAEEIADIRLKKGLEADVEGIDLGRLLTTINGRIEILLDRDHAIGHSYFLTCKTIGDLKDTFYKNIVPLLQEYFYGDYGKIGLVLGAEFVRIKKDDEKVEFAAFDYENRELFEEKKLYKMIDYRIGDNADDKLFVSAINTLLGIKSEPAGEQ